MAMAMAMAGRFLCTRRVHNAYLVFCTSLIGLFRASFLFLERGSKARSLVLREAIHLWKCTICEPLHTPCVCHVHGVLGVLVPVVNDQPVVGVLVEPPALQERADERVGLLVPTDSLGD